MSLRGEVIARKFGEGGGGVGGCGWGGCETKYRGKP